MYKARSLVEQDWGKNCGNLREEKESREVDEAGKCRTVPRTYPRLRLVFVNLKGDLPAYILFLVVYKLIPIFDDLSNF
jgi:hypothetical protein